ncbi:MAG: terpene synthase [Alphaproteobacteria bacterium]|jgi:2-methylisoborneol synthase|nr:terpene synthase [Alphaproteobacteria bacterium]MDF3033048.1 terpene synthase [Alphaproteobacteria bacterium]
MEKTSAKEERTDRGVNDCELGNPAYTLRCWNNGVGAPLYCPTTERINNSLADEINERLAAWEQDCGFDEDEIKKIQKCRFGHLVMLTHPDCDDPDRLLVAAKMNAAWWLADDYYADDISLGAKPDLLPGRLVLAMAAMDPLPPAGEFSVPLDKALASERILVALRSALDYMARYATAEQIQRTCYATFAMFVSWNGYAAWKQAGTCPLPWEYLAARQHDSFYTSMTLIDVIGGYHLPADLFYSPRVRRAAFQAGTAVVLLNDLYSISRDMADEMPNIVLQTAVDRGCSIEEATAVAIHLHNGMVRDFEESHRSLLSIPCRELQQFMCGLRAWMGGAFEWHDSNPRYRR